MRLKIIHETNYSFNKGVFLEPHYLRFQLRTTAYQTIESSELVITPKPTGLSQQTDAESNLIHFAWFDGITHALEILATTVIQTTPFNPFNFLVSPAEYLKTPFAYSSYHLSSLSACLEPTRIGQKLMRYGDKLLEQTKGHTVNFVIQLTRQIHNDFTIEERLVGAPLDPDDTFNRKIGSCRDVSWMQIQLLRHVGIAARFVSGYYFIDEEITDFELHGWVEVFLPGAGWIGLDPSHGILTGDHHLPICASAHHKATMPVTGTTRGEATADLRTQLQIKKLPTAPPAS